MPICPKCGIRERPPGNGRNKYRPYCNECNNILVREWEKNNPDRVKVHRENYYPRGGYDSRLAHQKKMSGREVEEINFPPTKICPRCGVEYTPACDGFNLNRQRADGFTYVCKSCRKEERNANRR